MKKSKRLRLRHFNVEEKTKIITRHLTAFDEPQARKIAEATACFTFNMLDELVSALHIIAEGNFY